MKMIVGLGNIGKEYARTRHNVGFMTLDTFAKKVGCSINKLKFSGLYGECFIHGEKVILLKPQSYINLSGEVIRRYVDFFDISIDDILIIHDDLDLPLGNFRIKKKGSSAGHNGLKNIELHLKTQEYKRIKIGISNDKSIDTKDYVLGRLSKEDNQTLESVIDTVMLVLDDYFVLPFDSLMSKYNVKNKK